MSLQSWYSRSNRSVCVDTRQTTGLSRGTSVAAVKLVKLVELLASLPDDLWLRESVGRLDSGDCEDVEVIELRPRETGRSRAEASRGFWCPKKCQLS
jgi:hypothetical protein